MNPLKHLKGYISSLVGSGSHPLPFICKCLNHLGKTPFKPANLVIMIGYNIPNLVNFAVSLPMHNTLTLFATRIVKN